MTGALLATTMMVSAIVFGWLSFSCSRSPLQTYALFAGVWGVALLVYVVFYVPGLPRLGDIAIYVMLAMVVITVGGVLGEASCAVSGVHMDAGLSTGKFEVVKWLPLVGSGLYFTALVVKFAHGDPIAYFRGAATIRIIFFGYAERGSPVVLSLLQMVGFLFVGQAFLGGLLRRVDLLVLSAISSALTAAAGFSRTPLLYAIGLALAGLHLSVVRGDRRPIIRRERILLLVVGILLGWATFNIIALMRDNGVQLLAADYSALLHVGHISSFQAVLFENVTYLTSSVANFASSWTMSTGTSLLGFRTWYSFWTIVARLMPQLGVARVVQGPVILPGSQRILDLFGTNVALNTYTALLEPLEDYGYVLSLGFWALLGFLASRSSRGRNVGVVYVSAIIWYFVLLSPLLDVFLSGAKAFVAGFLFLWVGLWAERKTWS